MRWDPQWGGNEPTPRSDDRTIFVCQRCYAHRLGEPPHGWDKPCPQQVAADEAYTAMLDAQRMAHIRTGQGLSEMGESLRRLTGDDDQEEGQ